MEDFGVPELKDFGSFEPKEWDSGKLHRSLYVCNTQGEGLRDGGDLRPSGLLEESSPEFNVLVTTVCSRGRTLAQVAGVGLRLCSCVATRSDTESAVLWSSLAELLTAVPLSPEDVLQDPLRVTETTIVR